MKVNAVMSDDERPFRIGDTLKDGGATLTFLGYTDDGRLRFHDSLDGDQFTLTCDDEYLADLIRDMNRERLRHFRP
jgi:hypothetical protein